MDMPLVDDIETGISEYDLSAYLCKEFNIELEEEEFYLKHFKSFSVKKIDACRVVESRESIPYKDEFDTADGEFVFLEEFDAHNTKIEGLHLITPKSPKSLNSQFNREECVYLHSSLDFEEGSDVTISSNNGSVTLKVGHNNDLRDDCVLIYSGTKGVNNLTSSKHSLDGKSAIFQENRVTILKC